MKIEIGCGNPKAVEALMDAANEVRNADQALVTAEAVMNGCHDDYQRACQDAESAANRLKRAKQALLALATEKCDAS